MKTAPPREAVTCPGIFPAGEGMCRAAITGACHDNVSLTRRPCAACGRLEHPAQ